MTAKISSLSLRYNRVKEEDRQETFMIGTIMVKEVIKIDIEQIMEIEKLSLVVEDNMNKIIEIGLGSMRTIGMILEEEILEGI